MKLPTCREAARLLFAQGQAGELPISPPEREALQAHLAECLACTRVQQQVALLRAADRAWQQRSRTEPGPGD